MNCAHHWIIDTPNGHETMPGTCRLCGATREHRTWVAEGGTERERQPESVAIGLVRANAARWPRKEMAG